MLKDTYLTFDQIVKEVEAISVINWTISVGQHPSEGPTVRFVGQLPDNDDPSQTIDIGIDEFLPPMPDVEYLRRWLFWRLQRVATHELREQFLVNGERVYDPHAEPAQ